MYHKNYMEDIICDYNYNSLIDFFNSFSNHFSIYHIIIKIIGTLNDKNTLLLMNILSKSIGSTKVDNRPTT